MKEVVIAGASRTPMGGFQGVFDGVPAAQLGGAAIRTALADAGVTLRDVRGIAVADPLAKASSFGELTRDAHCAVTVDAGERPYQGIVEVNGESLAASLLAYESLDDSVLQRMETDNHETTARGQETADTSETSPQLI